jgi:thiol-disulfide isomerase/thioredoxin
MKLMSFDFNGFFSGNKEKLPEIYGDNWLNSPTLGLMDMIGKVLLVNFWTYSSHNCLKTLPYLQDWWQKYKDMGFLIISIHTPEFEFESNAQNLSNALKELNITWPVLLDNEYENWQNFENEYWPAFYLANRRGEIVSKSAGEVKYESIEVKIQELVNDHYDAGAMPTINTTGHQHALECFPPTPETYTGTEKGVLINPEGFDLEDVLDYAPLTELPFTEGAFGLAGKFLANDQYVQTVETGSAIHVPFHATQINAVLRPVSEHAVIEVRVNGAMISPNARGKDVREDGTLITSTPRMYNLVKLATGIKGSVSLIAREGNFQCYSFTFSGCIE